jgi:hypothetical protein
MVWFGAMVSPGFIPPIWVVCGVGIVVVVVVPDWVVDEQAPSPRTRVAVTAAMAARWRMGSFGDFVTGGNWYDIP